MFFSVGAPFLNSQIASFSLHVKGKRACTETGQLVNWLHDETGQHFPASQQFSNAAPKEAAGVSGRGSGEMKPASLNPTTVTCHTVHIMSSRFTSFRANRWISFPPPAHSHQTLPGNSGRLCRVNFCETYKLIKAKVLTGGNYQITSVH